MNVDKAIEQFKSVGRSILDSPCSEQCPTVFGVSGLRAQPWWEWPEVSEILAIAYPIILKEFMNVRDKLQFEKIQRDVLSGEWTMFPLLDEGHWVVSQETLLPQTVAILRKFPIFENALGYVYFSELSPGTVIRSHCGPTNAKLRLQLPLEIRNVYGDSSSTMKSNQYENILTVGNIQHPFEVGRVEIFDDSFVHSVSIDARCSRLSLVADLWHPDLVHDLSSKSKISVLFTTVNSVDTTVVDNAQIERRTGIHPSQCVRAESSNSTDYNMLFKFLLIGDCCVGKSAFVLRLSDNSFNETFMSTIGVDFKIISVDYSSSHTENMTKRIKLQIWDTAGPERFRTITSSYYKGCHGIFVCFDIFDKASFEDIPRWMAEIDRYDVQGAARVLVGMKNDGMFPDAKLRAVSVSEAQTLAKQFQCQYVECSSRSGEGVFEAIQTLIDEVFVSRKYINATTSRDRGLPQDTAAPTRAPQRTGGTCIVL